MRSEVNTFVDGKLSDNIGEHGEVMFQPPHRLW